MDKNSYSRLIPYRKGDKWGFCTSDKQLVVHCQYSSVRSFVNDGTWAVQMDDRWGCINMFGKEVVPCLYKWTDFALTFRFGLFNAKGKIPKGWRVIDDSPEIATSNVSFDSDVFEKYQYMGSFSEGVVPVVIDGQWGYANRSGDIVIPCIYDRSFEFSGGLACVEKNNKRGFIDCSGNVIIDFIFDDARIFYQGIAIVRIENKVGFIDRSGNYKTPLIYEHADPFLYGVACVQKDGKWGCVDFNGIQMIPTIYENAFQFYEGIACVQKDKHYGFIKIDGTEMTPFIYDAVRMYNSSDEYEYFKGVKYNGFIADVPVRNYFSEGYAVVKRNNKYGYIDVFGREVLECKYDEANNFANGIAKVSKGYINKDGVEFWED